MYAPNTPAAKTIATLRQIRRENSALHAARIQAIKDRNYKLIVAANLANFFAAVAQFASEQAEKPAQAKPEFTTKKALVTACQSMDLDTVLFDANRRSSNNRGHAVEVALSHFFTTTFGQQFHAVRDGEAQVANPKWFKQLYTDLAWSAYDITPGSILQALA